MATATATSIEHERAVAEEEEVVYVAVGRETKEWRANLQWVLRNVPRRKKLVLVHVHRPAARINMMGAWVPVSQIAEQEVVAYRQLEMKKIHRILDDFLDICASQTVNADKIVIQSSDIAGGLVDLIGKHGVNELVMGAASDGRYSRKMRAPRSKKALTVLQKAVPSCKIWFVCNGNLVCTREVGEIRADSITPSTSPRSSTSDTSRSKSSQQQHSKPLITMTSQEENAADGSVGTWNPYPESEPSNIAGTSAMDAAAESESESAGLRSLDDADDDYQMSPHDDLDDAVIDTKLYEQLRDALIEAENLKSEAYEESRRRQKAERDLADASRRVKEAESSYLREVKRRKEIEERLAREKIEMERDRQQLDGILDQIKKANERSESLELQIANSDRTIDDFEGKLSESYRLLQTLRLEQRQVHLQKGKPGIKSSSASHGKTSFLEFAYAELKRATDDFDESVKIGTGGHGSVYKGVLRDMTVAIKMLNPESVQHEMEFTREVEILSKIRHPNLVTLIGACREARALVYEFVPNRSLEDHLRSESRAMPLPWHVRARIAHQTCAALIFLHASEIQPLVHGDLKPDNVLLDEHGACKLSDIGIGRLFDMSDTARATLAYVDPHYLATGELTPRCDVYSFGMLLLRLLTGKPAFRAKKAVREALDKGSLHEVVDASAGEWPLEHAKEMALLGVRCCDLERKRCPDLAEESARVLEPVVSAAPCRVSPSPSFRSDSDGNHCIPSYFLCPILKEIMKDPQIAADGFTYESDAIKRWLESGHDTSPMTNLKLASSELIPNHALRSAIQEWLQKRRNFCLFSSTK